MYGPEPSRPLYGPEIEPTAPLGIEYVPKPPSNPSGYGYYPKSPKYVSRPLPGQRPVYGPDPTYGPSQKEPTQIYLPRVNKPLSNNSPLTPNERRDGSISASGRINF